MAKQTCTSADLGFLLEAMAKTLGGPIETQQFHE
jgi:hypothetical protein